MRIYFKFLNFRDEKNNLNLLSAFQMAQLFFIQLLLQKIFQKKFKTTRRTKKCFYWIKIGTEPLNRTVHNERLKRNEL